MFLKKIVQISLLLTVISSMSVNVAYSRANATKSSQYLTEFTPLTPLPPVSNPAYSKICTGGVMFQEMSLNLSSLGMGGGGNGGGGMPPGGGMQEPTIYEAKFTATTRLAYNDPTGVNNDVCRTIPLNATLAFLTTAITQDGSQTRVNPAKDARFARAVNDVSSVSINNSTMFITSSTSSGRICLKTSHLSNAAGVVLLKNRELCDSIMF